jgi:hypothetical protein
MGQEACLAKQGFEDGEKKKQTKKSFQMEMDFLLLTFLQGFFYLLFTFFSPVFYMC